MAAENSESHGLGLRALFASRVGSQHVVSPLRHQGVKLWLGQAVDQETLLQPEVAILELRGVLLLVDDFW